MHRPPGGAQVTAVLAWLALAAACASWPARARPERGDRPARPRRHVGPLRARGLTVMAVAAVGALAVATLGAVRGGVVAFVAGPAVAAAVSRSAVRRVSRLGAGVPFALDLAATVLRGGAPVSTALEQAAPAAGGELGRQLVHTARLLRLGATPAEAWRGVADDPRLASLAAVSRRSATSGVRLAAAWEQVASELRAQRRAEALGRAHRAGVFAMAPLGLCFLPAFVCLGVIPDVLGVARDVLGGATAGR